MTDSTVIATPQRVPLIERLEELRGTAVITYFTSTRPNLESPMAMDVIPVLYRHLARQPRARYEAGIDLVLHTNGGEGVVPWRLLTILRSFASIVNVLVPHNAFSGGTLAALGADRVVMHPMGTLGPIDPTVVSWFNPPHPDLPGRRLGISVEDLASFFDFLQDDIGTDDPQRTTQAVLALMQQVHPLALGSVKRSTLQSRMLGERLLRQGGAKDSTALTEIVERLATQLHSHGHPIGSREAREDLGLVHVEEATEEVADVMWQLYESYAEEMQLENAFEPIEMLSAGTLLPLPEPQTMLRLQRQLGPYSVVCVESSSRADAFELSYDGVLTRDWGGAVGVNVTLVQAGWKQRR